MNTPISLIKGAHPGFILARELKQRKLAKGRFAMSLNEFPQTLVSITTGKRRMNTPLAMKIEKALGLEEGLFYDPAGILRYRRRKTQAAYSAS